MEEVKKLCIFPDDYGMSRRCFSSCVILQNELSAYLTSAEWERVLKNRSKAKNLKILFPTVFCSRP